MRTVLASLTLLLAAAPAFAAERYRFDEVHSQVAFHVSHLGFTRSEGEFHEIEGGFEFDRDDWSKSRCDVEIGVASLDMDHEAWNRTMLGADWFDAKAHPRMRFACRAVRRFDDANGEIDGDLSIRGVTRPVTLKLRFNREGVHKFSLQYTAGFSASTTIRRSDFGMAKHIPDIGDEVEIRLEIEGIREGVKRGRKK